MYLPLSVRHVSDGIARIKNILKYYILMCVVLYISKDNMGTNVHIYLINYVNYIELELVELYSQYKEGQIYV